MHTCYCPAFFLLPCSTLSFLHVRCRLLLLPSPPSCLVRLHTLSCQNHKAHVQHHSVHPHPSGLISRTQQYPELWWIIVLHMLRIEGIRTLCTLRLLEQPKAGQVEVSRWFCKILALQRRLHSLLRRDLRSILPCRSCWYPRSASGLLLHGRYYPNANESHPLDHLAPMHLAIEALDTVHRLLHQPLKATRRSNALRAQASKVFPLEEKHSRELQTLNLQNALRDLQLLCDTAVYLDLFGFDMHGYRLSDIFVCDLFASLNCMGPLNVAFLLHCQLRVHITGHSFCARGQLWDGVGRKPRATVLLKPFCQCCSCRASHTFRACPLCSPRLAYDIRDHLTRNTLHRQLLHFME